MPRIHQCLDARQELLGEAGGAFNAADVLSIFCTQIYMPRLPGGFLCPPDLNRALPAVSKLAANRILEPPHRSGTAMLDLLAPVAPMANVPQQLLTVFYSAPPPPAFLLLDLTVTEITAGGAVLLHQASLAVAITPASPGGTDK